MSGSQAAGSDLSSEKSPIGGYGAKSSYSPADLTQKEWDESKQPWSASPQGRLGIRLVSRGILGAAFYTAGGMLTRKWMHDPGVRWGRYVPEAENYTGGKYDASKSLFEQDNPLKIIAKLIDTVVGKPIEVTVRTITGSEELAARSVRFRPTKYKDAMHNAYMRDMAAFKEAVSKGLTGTALPPRPRYYRGRSLGNEAVSVTFDFFCMSIGDAMGRDIAGWVDPSVRNKWMKDGHFSIPAAVKELTRSTWRYVSYNGGEDWAVAIPYVYFMKGQRQLINKISPGFAYDFDRNLNGGSFKIDERGHIVGNYNLEGMLDLQGRFTFYNMGTLAYRELYDYTARKLEGKHAVLYGAPDKDTSQQTAGEKAASVAKWLARSVVKAGIYMTPTVPFFWITRTPQTKYRGLFIHTDKAGHAWTLNYENPNVMAKLDPERGIFRKYQNVYANAFKDKPRNTGTGLMQDTPVYFSQFSPDPDKHPGRQFNWISELPGREVNPVARDFPFKPYEKTQGIIDSVLNFIGLGNYRAGHMADAGLKRAGERLKAYPRTDKAIKNVLSLRPGEGLERFAHPFVNASIAYTPYAYAKSEFANLWDDGKMDLATERMIDGGAKLNWGEFKAGAGEVWRTFLHKPLLDEAREKEAQRRIELDTSPPASVNYDSQEHDAIKKTHAQSNWRERLVQGEKPEIGANSPKSHAEREEMREALKDLQPPTPSIN